MKKQILTFILILCEGLLKISAQSPEQPVNIQSPTAASLGKYGDVPVSYFTGTSGINVPIRQFNSDGIVLDVSLDYDASGIRVNSPSNFAGQNWNLNAGGVIMRTINGSADESTMLNANTNTRFNYSWFKIRNTPAQVNVSDINQLVALSNCGNSGSDPLPDTFIFNFMGMTGKFYLGNDGEWKVQSDHNMEVIFNINNWNTAPPVYEYYYKNSSKYEPTIYGFTLRDDKGNTYEFGNNTNAIEYSINFMKQNPVVSQSGVVSQWNANAWYLTKVTNPFGKVVYSFEYTRGFFIADLQYMAYHELQKTKVGSSYRTSASGNMNDIGGCLISPVYLSKIKTIEGASIIFYIGDILNAYENKSADINTKRNSILYTLPNYTSINYNVFCYLEDAMFEYNKGGTPTDPIKGLSWRRLNEIYITTGAGVHEVYMFYYDDNIKYRNKLVKIERMDETRFYGEVKNKIPMYEFEYDRFEQLPAPLSKAIDHWGYYKGSDWMNITPYSNGAYNMDQINSYTVNRNPNSSYLTIGMLKKIIYPTKGYTTFDYEPNSYSQVVSDDRKSLVNESGYGPGLRVSAISDYDGQQTRTRNFSYSGGILVFKPNYYTEKKAYVSDNGEYLIQQFNSNSIVPLSNFFGHTIGYSTVTESEPGRGSTQYEFANYNEFKDIQPIATLNSEYNPYKRNYGDVGFMLGKLEKKTAYDSGNNIKESTTYTYRSDLNNDYNYIQCSDISCGLVSIPDIGHSYFYAGNVFRIYYSNYDVVKEVQSSYPGPVTKQLTYNKKDTFLYVNSFGYNHKINIRYLKNYEILASQNELYSKAYTYPFQSTTSITTDLTNAFRIFDPVIESETKNGNTLHVRKVNYNTFNGIIAPGEELSSKDNINFKQDIRYLDYNSNGKVTHYIMNEKDIYLLWGHNLTLPVCMIEWNPSDSDIENVLRTYSNLDDLRSLLEESLVTTYTYRLLVGLESITSPAGIKTTYKYDTFSRLKEVLDRQNRVVNQYFYNYR